MAEQKGLYSKYKVIKIEDGTTVEDCFILRPDKDPAAVVALQAYAAATSNKALANDIHKWVGEKPSEWISVEEKPPENEEPVLIRGVQEGLWGKEREIVMTAFHTDGTTHTEDSDNIWELGDVDMEYCEETDDYIIPEGWWEDVRCGEEFAQLDDDLTVTHWMPLPEAPKEG